jgi:phage FluMu protein Com
LERWRKTVIIRKKGVYSVIVNLSLALTLAIITGSIVVFFFVAAGLQVAALILILLTEKKHVKFVCKEKKENSTYEVYKGTDAESAKTFLLTNRVTKKLYYIIVETPEGNWGMDVKGLYLERLLPWQKNIESAKCEGAFIFMSWTTFGLTVAAKGINDNFVLTVQCGKCEHKWQDGVRYQNITIVRCPKCKTLNKINTNNIHVVSK